MNRTNILYTHRHPSHPFLYSYLQLSFHHKSSSNKSPYLNLQYLSDPYLTHHFQLILFTHSLISPFPWFHYQQPTTSKSAKPFSVLHVFFFFFTHSVFCFVGVLGFMGFLEAPEIQILGVVMATVAVVDGAAYFYSTRKPEKTKRKCTLFMLTLHLKTFS